MKMSLNQPIFSFIFDNLHRKFSFQKKFWRYNLYLYEFLSRNHYPLPYPLLAFLRAQSGVSMVASRKNERKVTSVLFHSSTQIGRFLCRFRWCDKYTQSFHVQIHVKRTS